MAKKISALEKNRSILLANLAKNEIEHTARLIEVTRQQIVSKTEDLNDFFVYQLKRLNKELKTLQNSKK